MSAEVVPDGVEPGQLVVSLVVRLSYGSTPFGQVGREVDVLLTRPMLEVLAGLAQDVGAVHYVIPTIQYEDDDGSL